MDGIVSSLTDFKFSKFAAPKLISVLYVWSFVVISLAAFVVIVVVFAGDDGSFVLKLGLAGLTIVVWSFFLLATRVFYELIAVVFRMHSELRSISRAVGSSDVELGVSDGVSSVAVENYRVSGGEEADEGSRGVSGDSDESSFGVVSEKVSGFSEGVSDVAVQGGFPSVSDLDVPHSEGVVHEFSDLSGGRESADAGSGGVSDSDLFEGSDSSFSVIESNVDVDASFGSGSGEPLDIDVLSVDLSDDVSSKPDLSVSDFGSSGTPSFLGSSDEDVSLVEGFDGWGAVSEGEGFISLEEKDAISLPLDAEDSERILVVASEVSSSVSDDGLFAAEVETEVEVETGPPSGWYPDPAGSSAQRFWDGSSWTEQLR